MKLRSQSASRPLSQDRTSRPSASADPLTATLIETGALSSEHIEQINDYCQRTGASFADAAVDLGLVSPEVTSRAVTAHVPSGLIDPDTSGVSPAVVAAYDPVDPLVIKLRALRSMLFNAEDLGHGPTRILVFAGIGTDNTAGVAANLAVLVAQLGVRGLLVDANFPTPTQHVLFGINSDLGVTSLLTGTARTDAVVETPVSNLDLLATGPDIAALSETAERVSLTALLRDLSRKYAFVIIDVGEQPADLVAALARGADGVVMVVERDQTPLSSLSELLNALQHVEVPVLGSVLAR
jgi:Mrp family chromosome partitioning ATPase